MLTFKTKFF